VLITGGDGDALLDALLALTDPGDEVVLTDPTYAGMLNRVHLAGAVPRLVPSVVRDGAWRLDLEALRAAVRPHTRALFVQNPTFPSGQLFDDEEWATIAQLCHQHDLWLIYWALFEGVVYDGAPIVHPASLPGLRDRLVTIGSVSIEQRMIGWRLGWIVAPHTVLPDLSVVHIYNSIVPGGIAQASALAAYTAPDDGLAACVAEWQRRRDVMLEQTRRAARHRSGWNVVTAAGRRQAGDRRGRLLSGATRPQGGRCADDRLGRAGRRPARAPRLQQRVSRPAATARRPHPTLKEFDAS